MTKKVSKRAKKLTRPDYAEKAMVSRRTGASKILMLLARGNTGVRADVPAVFHLGAMTGLF